MEIADHQGTRTAGKNSRTTEAEHVPLMATEEADPRTETEENRDSPIIEGTALTVVTAADNDTETATITRGDPDQEGDQTRTTRRLGTEVDIPRMTGDKIRGKDPEAPTPIMTGEGITAGMKGMTDSHGATRGTGTDLRTADTGSKDTRIATKTAGSDSSRREADGACHQRST